MKHRHFKTLRSAERYRDKLRARPVAALKKGCEFIVWADDFGWAVALVDRNGRKIALCA